VAEAIELLARISLERGQPGEALMLLDEVEPLIRTGGSSPGLAQYRLERPARWSRSASGVAAALATQVAAQLDALQPPRPLQLADLFRGSATAPCAGAHEQAIELAEGGALAYLACLPRARRPARPRAGGTRRSSCSGAGASVHGGRTGPLSGARRTGRRRGGPGSRLGSPLP
jgi:hypothetical protein